ncbi:MAG: hypothetical protein SWH68_14380 [Thermodesulfobacteriota bacterium]|nr:hypothetical protein [Thermodesulfobacteriota bacterium]
MQRNTDIGLFTKPSFKTKASFLTTEYTEEHGRNHLAPFFRALSVYSVVNQTAVDYDHEKVEVAKQSFDPAIIRSFLRKRRTWRWKLLTKPLPLKQRQKNAGEQRRFTGVYIHACVVIQRNR